MNNILSYITNHLLVLKPLLIITAATALTFIEKSLFKKICPRLVRRAKIWDESLLMAAHQPLIFLIWATSLNFTYQAISALYPHLNLGDVTLLNKTIIVIFLAWFLLSLINKLESKITEKTNKHLLESDLTTIIALSQISRFIVISALSLVFLQSIGISISAILAFGGVGALTVGFAAKDTLANLLGGLMIFIDRPFSVGDTIKTPDNQIEGTVEHIGWRLTRIRDPEMNACYVPNALFSSVTLVNLSRIKSRRIKTIIKLRFHDLNELTPIVEEIKQLLQTHTGIDQKQAIAVSLENIGEYSLNLLILAFTRTTEWLKYLAVQQEVFLEILKILDKHRAKLAVPLTAFSDSPEVWQNYSRGIQNESAKI